MQTHGLLCTAVCTSLWRHVSMHTGRVGWGSRHTALPITQGGTQWGMVHAQGVGRTVRNRCGMCYTPAHAYKHSTELIREAERRRLSVSASHCSIKVCYFQSAGFRGGCRYHLAPKSHSSTSSRNPTCHGEVVPVACPVVEPHTSTCTLW